MNILLNITPLYASLLALLLIIHSIRIVRLRIKFKVGVGDGQQSPLVAAIRVHGNFIEYVPLGLILLACYEINGGAPLMVHLLGAALFLGRVFHAIGLHSSIGTSTPRATGMIMTFATLLVLSVENIRLFLS